MISVNEALERILSRIEPIGYEKVSLLDALRRVLAEDIEAGRDVPPMDNSGMDGYAVRFEDVRTASRDHPALLRVIEDLPAGFIASHPVERGQAIRIMTGAPVPKGADTIIPVEETEKKGDAVLIFTGCPPGEYIRRAGGDIRKGDRVLSKGDVLYPPEIGVLASIGRSSIQVYQKPLVAILCTGEELVDVDGPLEGVRIVSSNSYTLAAQVLECGAVALQLGIARDRREDVLEKLRQGIRADFLISSAGISVGDYDFVKEALHELGMELIFWRVAMKPGKPMAFGILKGKPVFGLPGNPVSSMVSFEQFVRPALMKKMGHRRILRPVVEALLEEPIFSEKGRRNFIRGFLSMKGQTYTVRTTGPQGSGVLKSMVKANGLIVVPEDRDHVEEGERVSVQVLGALE